VPLGGEGDVSAAVEAASAAFPEWRRTPLEERIQYLFKLKQLLGAARIPGSIACMTRGHGQRLTCPIGQLDHSTKRVLNVIDDIRIMITVRELNCCLEDEVCIMGFIRTPQRGSC